jgi:hypothetical protein
MKNTLRSPSFSGRGAWQKCRPADEDVAADGRPLPDE